MEQVLTLVGDVLGQVTEEKPKHDAGAGYEIRRYPPCLAAEVTYDPKDMKGDADGGFTVLAKYIGAFGKPENTKAEGVAMTAPVITTGGGEGESSEPIAMTAPVITLSSEPIAMTAPVITSSEPEPVAMTAPVITASGDANPQAPGKVTMQFLLPSKYTKADEAPRPTDERVVIREVAERKFAVVRFSGLTRDKTVKEKADGLKAALAKDGYVAKGPFLLARYNPPWTLPPLRTNEVMIPVE